MEKLLELLKEYIRLKFEFGEYGVYINKQNKLILEKQHSFMGYGLDEEWYQDVEYGESIIISKQFEFIKWLVEKDKIDFSIMRINAGYELYENFIMYLSIQDDPIKYLISYLK